MIRWAAPRLLSAADLQVPVLFWLAMMSSLGNNLWDFLFMLCLRHRALKYVDLCASIYHIPGTIDRDVAACSSGFTTNWLSVHPLSLTNIAQGSAVTMTLLHGVIFYYLLSLLRTLKDELFLEYPTSTILVQSYIGNTCFPKYL